MKKKLRLRCRNFFRTQSPPFFDKIAGLCSIIGFIISVLSFLWSGIQEWGDWNVTGGNIIISWWDTNKIWLGISWVSIISIILIMMIIKYRNASIIKMNASAEGLSYIMNKTLEFIDNLNELDDSIEKENCKECQYIKSLQRNFLYTKFIEYTILFLDAVADIICDYVSYDVSACVKLVVNYTQNNGNAERKGVVTLARDSKSDELRNTLPIKEPVPIEQNSDFYDIICGNQLKF